MKPKSVDSYVASFPEPQRTMLKQLRATILAACPRAEEMISYDIPFYQYRSPGYPGRMAYFAGYKSFVSFYAVPSALPADLAAQVARYRKAKATLQFPVGSKLPLSLIRRLVKLRMKEIDATLKGAPKKKAAKRSAPTSRSDSAARPGPRRRDSRPAARSSGRRR
jgi:uncharacterized protein YdhG (YjbR/CyaY superfamily)